MPKSQIFKWKLFHTCSKEPIFYSKKKFLILAWKSNQLLIIARKFFFQTQSFLYLSEKLISCTHPKTQFFERKHFSRSFERTDLLARSPEVVEIELFMASYSYCLTVTFRIWKWKQKENKNENENKNKKENKNEDENKNENEKQKQKRKWKKKTKTKMKNEIKTKMKTKIKMNFRFYFHFELHFGFCFCFSFLKVFTFLLVPCGLEVL